MAKNSIISSFKKWVGPAGLVTLIGVFIVDALVGQYI